MKAGGGSTIDIFYVVYFFNTIYIGYCTLYISHHICTKSILYFQSGQYYDGSSCKTCEKGYYCPSPLAGHLPCPDGTYTDSTGLRSCTTCAAGKKCYPTSATPSDCAAGTYSPAGQGLCIVSIHCGWSLYLHMCSTVQRDWFIKGTVVCGLPVIHSPKRSLGAI
jgi:hypothetical protein